MFGLSRHKSSTACLSNVWHFNSPTHNKKNKGYFLIDDKPSNWSEMQLVLSLSYSISNEISKIRCHFIENLKSSIIFNQSSRELEKEKCSIEKKESIPIECQNEKD